MKLWRFGRLGTVVDHVYDGHRLTQEQWWTTNRLIGWLWPKMRKYQVIWGVRVGGRLERRGIIKPGDKIPKTTLFYWTWTAVDKIVAPVVFWLFCRRVPQPSREYPEVLHQVPPQ